MRQGFKIIDLAKLAAESGLEITVAHYLPGTSRCNGIEHKMFHCISINWRGRPLVCHRTLIALISMTTTKGLTIRAEADLNGYETGTEVTDVEPAGVPLTAHDFHGDGNDTIARSNSR
jgi:hypothetical protein